MNPEHEIEGKEPVLQGSKGRFRRLALYGAGAVFAAVALWSSFLRSQYLVLSADDTACLAECVEAAWTKGLPYSDIKAKMLYYFYDKQNQVLSASADSICARDFGPFSLEPINQFRRHTYFIIYLWAPLTAFFSGETVALFLNALALWAFIPVAAALSRRLGLGWPVTALFCLTLMSMPPWALSLSSGQPYPDRFFLPLFLGCLCCLAGKRLRWPFYLLGVLAAATVDRAGLMAGIVLVLYAVLYCWRDKPRRNALIAFGCALAAFSMAVVKFFLISEYTGSFLSSILSLSFLTNPESLRNIGLMFLVLSPLLFCAAFDWRALGIALVAMAPNVMGSMGGGEKTGWPTHYHSFYMPVLTWAALMGISRAWAWARGSATRRYGAYASLAGVLLLALTVSPFPDQDKFGLASLRNIPRYNTLPRLAEWTEDYLKAPQSSFFAHTRMVRGQLEEAVPKGSTVSMVYPAISALYKDRTLYYYPQGMDDAEYVVIEYTQRPDGSVEPAGLLSYLPPEEKAKAQACVNERLERQFDVQGAKRIGSYLVIKRR